MVAVAWFAELLCVVELYSAGEPPLVHEPPYDIAADVSSTTTLANAPGGTALSDDVGFIGKSYKI